MENENKVNRPDIVITNGIATWEMRMEGDFNGTFTGVFKFRCGLTPTQLIAADRETRQLLGPSPGAAGQREAWYSVVLPALKYRVLEAPPFWSATSTQSGYAGDLVDENVINAVYATALDAEIKWKAIKLDQKIAYIMKAKDAAEAIMSAKDQKKADKSIDEEFDEL